MPKHPRSGRPLARAGPGTPDPERRTPDSRARTTDFGPRTRVPLMNYQNFDLLIDRSGENLRAQVLNSPAGQATVEFVLPFSEDKLEIFLLKLGGRTRRGTTRRVETQEMSAAKIPRLPLGQLSNLKTHPVQSSLRPRTEGARRLTINRPFEFVAAARFFLPPCGCSYHRH